MNKRYKRRKSIRKKISGTKDKPRVSVFRSSKHIYVQVIDDENSETLVCYSDLKLKDASKKSKVDIASEVGNKLGELMKEKGILSAVFDRSGYKYHGRVKAIAEGIRNQEIKL